MDTINFENMICAMSGDESQVLGKLVLFSLSNILVDKEKLQELCDSLDIPYAGGRRLSVSDAFRSATSDIKESVSVKRDGERRIYQIYCRDNERSSNLLSRELVKETQGLRTNQYEKLANIHFDRADKQFGYDNISYDAEIDVVAYCRQAEELFERYQSCANRKQIETICLGYLRSLEATKVIANGYAYFVPRHHMEKVDIFKTFVKELSAINYNKVPLKVKVAYLVNDAEQRDELTEDFYSAVKKDIEEYQASASHLISSGSTSPSIMERWVVKIQALEEKKRHYEDILRRELNGLDDEFETLKFLSEELTIRARGLRFRKAA